MWDDLNSTYWFLPCVMLALSVVLAAVTIWIDYKWFGSIRQPSGVLQWVYGGSPEGARSLLSTIATSVITVAGVAFTITITTLAQASQQFGPRLLRNYMKDRGNQLVLGVFLSTFFYCVLVMRSFHGTGVQAFVPQVSVIAAIALALTCVLFLIYFIHHTSHNLQAAIIISNALREMELSLQRSFPERPGKKELDTPKDGHAEFPQDFDDKAKAILSCDIGYIQAIDHEGLMDIAEGADLLLKVDFRPGKYVVADSPIVWLYPAEHHSANLEKRLRNKFIIGSERTNEQDLEFAIDQMSEIAIRALSSGINDPFTAENCIDALCASLAEIAKIPHLDGKCYDKKGLLRIIMDDYTFSGFVDEAFNRIRQYGAGSVGVLIHLLDALGALAQIVTTEEQKSALRRHVQLTYHQLTRDKLAPEDLKDFRKRYFKAIKTLG